MSASSYSAAVQELYVTYFGRPADGLALINFDAALAAANAPTDVAMLSQAYNTDATIKALIDSFGTSAESVALYGKIGSDLASAQAFVTSVFEHVLNRAPASAGLAFWSNAIVSGSLSPGNAALSIAAGAQTNTTTQGLIDAHTLANKISVATEFTADVSDANGLAAYSGAAAAAAARALLSAVTSTTVLSAYLPEIEQVVSILSGGTVNLTAGIDNLTGSNSNTIFNAILDNAAGLAAGGDAATLNAGDVITGGTGANTLNITDEGLGSNLAIPPGATLTGITSLTVSSTENIGTQDFSHWTGLTSVNISKSTGTANVTVAGTTSIAVNDTGTAGTVTTNGGSSVTVTTDANHAVAVNGGTATTTVAVTGGNGATVVDANYSNGHANSIATVSVTAPIGATTIDSNVLTTLGITGDNGPAVFVNASIANAPALALTLDGDKDSLIEVNSAQALSVTTANTASSNVTLIVPLATAVNFSDTVDLSLHSLTAGAAVSVTIAGAGAFSGDLTAASNTATISATNATGVTTVSLASGQTFVGGAGQDIVTETAVPTVSVAGGAATNNVIDFKDLVSTVSTSFAKLSNFATFEVSGASSGTFNLPTTNSYTAIDVEGAGGDLHFQSSVPGPALTIGVSDAHNIIVANTGTYATGATSTINIGNAGTTGLTVGLVSITDGVAGGSQNLVINSNSAAGQSNTIGTLAAGRDTFTFTGNAAVIIGNNDALGDATLTFNNSAGSTASSIAGITDNALSLLNFQGGSATTLTVLHSTATSLTIADSDSAAVNVGQIADNAITALSLSSTSTAVHAGLDLGSETLPALKTLSLSGGVAVSLIGDAVTTGITISGATDNAAVSFTSSGVTAAGDTDTVTLGNGIDNITLGAGTATSTQTVTLGTGAGDTLTTASVGTVHVTLGTSTSGSDTVVASGTGATLTVTAGNGNNHITAAGAGDTLTIAVGSGANVIATGNAATGTINFSAHTAADQVQLGTYGNAASLTNIVKITGLNASGADSLTFSGGVTSVQEIGSANVTAAGGNPATLAGWVAAAVGLGGTVPQSAHGLEWFQFSGNTYLVETAGASDAGVLNSADTVVELAGTAYNFGSTSLQGGKVLLNGGGTVQPATATFTLTAGTDTFVGNALANTFNAILDNSAGITASGPVATLTTGDALTGASGALTSNILNITDDGLGTNMAIPTSTITGIQTFNITSKEAISSDFSGYVGLTALNITASVGNDSVTAAHTTNVALTETGTAATLVGGGVDVISGTATNALASVSLTNAGGATTINSNALTTLNLTSTSAAVTVNAAAATRALALNLSSAGSGISVTDATATTVNVTASGAAVSNASLNFAAATAITLNDSVNVLNAQITAHSATGLTISGSGNFSGDLTGLNAAAVIATSSSTGVTTVTLGAGESITAGSNEVIATVNAAPTATINLGSNAQSELILSNLGAVTGTPLSHVSHVAIIDTTGNTSGTFDMTGLSTTSVFDVLQSTGAGALSFTNVTQGASGALLDVDAGYAHTLTLQYGDASGATDAAKLILGGVSSTGTAISQLALQDSGSNGVGIIQIQSEGTGTNTISTLNDNQANSIAVSAGTAAFAITTLTDGASSLAITNADSKAFTIGTFTDNALTSLSVSSQGSAGAEAFTLTTFDSTATNLIVTNSHATGGSFAVTNFNDTSLISATFDNSVSDTGGVTMSIGASTQSALSSLTLNGSVAISIAGDTVTTGITLSGATDNAIVTFASTGVTADAATDTITLGNGNDTVTLGAGTALSHHSITLGSGSNAVTDNTLGSTTISTSETSGKTETIHADSAANATITTGNGNDTVSANAIGATVNITVGNGANSISVSDGTSGTIATGTGANAIVTGASATLGITLGAHAGVDAITIGANASTAAFTSIAGILAGDTISFAGDTAASGALLGVLSADVTTAGGDPAVLADWFTTALTNATQHQVAWFQFGGNTYLIEQSASGGATTLTGDTVIELVGLHNEAAANVNSHVMTVA